MNDKYYYNLALPVNVSTYFTYYCEQKLEVGCRVLVNFRGRYLTAFVIASVNKPSNVTVKQVIEVIDTKSKINSDIFNLALFISNYYICPLGVVLYSILPKGMQIQVSKKVMLLTNDVNNLSALQQKLTRQLTLNSYTDIALLKLEKLFCTIESLEELGIVKVLRSIDPKIKPKKVNYISILSNNKDIVKSLTNNQLKAYNLINSNLTIKQSKVAKQFSYSTIKSLQTKGLIKIFFKLQDENTAYNFKHDDTYKNKIINFTDEQQSAILAVNKCVDDNTFKPFLLHGITGSGKTEVYIEVIKKCLSMQKNAIMLVPEISLTPQMISKFYSIFGEGIAVLHSKLSEKKRWQQYKEIAKGNAKIVIGVRSAIFAPLKNIGVIICDEEHENSYKQEKSPRYNARDIAIVRAKASNAPVILGSATPSLESYINAQNGKYTLLKLTKRPVKAVLPTVEIVDMKNYPAKTVFSDILKNEIEATLKNNKQIILFQNRRGYSSYMQCTNCGELLKCPNCDISLNYHKNQNMLKCHYCNYQKPAPRACPNCNSYVFNFGSFGTQAVESQLNIIFPNAKVLRMDSDTVSSKQSYNNMFEMMKNKEVDILLGTQMIAKGLDFENVTLVGVINADTSLNIPDFRASEKAFQLLTQVAGRAGRGKYKGKVIVQTLLPGHYAIQTAKNQNYSSFINYELELRKSINYPPYSKMARLIFASKNSYSLNKLNLDAITDYLNKQNPEMQVLGPVEPPIVKINKEHRIHLIIKAKSIKLVLQAANFIKSQIKLPSNVKLSIDINPINLL